MCRLMNPPKSIPPCHQQSLQLLFESKLFPKTKTASMNTKTATTFMAATER